MKISEKDFKILDELQVNSNQSLSVLSKKLKVSQSALHARIKKLERDGVIKGYHAEVDPEKVGLPVTAFVLASFASVRATQSSKKQAEEVAKDPRILEAFIVSGQNDMILKIRGRNEKEIGGHVLDNLNTTFRTNTCFVLHTAKDTQNLNLSKIMKTEP